LQPLARRPSACLKQMRADMKNSILCVLATLGPIGKLPAPGTAGSAVGLFTGWFLAQYGFYILAFATLIALVIGTIAAETYSRVTDTKDASEVIIDELAGQWSVLLCVPFASEHIIILFLAAFVLFRLFDITKIGPVGWAEKIQGGIGIMADDMVAGALAGLCLLAAQLALAGGF